MDLSNAEPFLSEHTHGVLMTLKREGRPQASNISYHYADGVARISVTDRRAKTRNLRRDPRGSLYVTSKDFWRFVVAEGTAELSDITTSPGDSAGQELLEVYNAISAEPHPDPDEFFRAMVADERLVIRLSVERVYGQLPG
ncbi:MAG: PPOX class F420-dependent oxidoreductase [Acidimicrobiia bacterium]|nr:PPOX class F420-dependent oxidoreductase [Acidimicrobiia bacterium]